jgi:hypothetical protein
MEQERVSRAGTARALVLLGSALLLAGSGVITFLALVFGPVLLDRDGLTGGMVVAVVAFVVVSLATIAVASLVALRAAGTRTVVMGGCGVLLAGGVVGVGVLLALITLR